MNEFRKINNFKIDPQMFGPRGQAYLEALQRASQSGALEAASSRDEYRSVLQPVRGQADEIYSRTVEPRDRVELSSR